LLLAEFFSSAVFHANVSVGKAGIPVQVIDHVEMPSAN
jgi:hypothetical protein